MRKLRTLLLVCGIAFALPAWAQTPMSTVSASEILTKGYFFLHREPYLLPAKSASNDTTTIVFQLINDSGRDTVLYLHEGLNDWIQIRTSEEHDSTAGYISQSGRKYYGRVAYDYVYYPARPVRFKKDGRYACEIKYISSPSQRSGNSIYLLSPVRYQNQLVRQKDFEYINNIVTYCFLGALAFGFTFFFFLFLKSRYFLFGVYAVFLFLQMLYGLIQFDVYTQVGKFMMSRFHWDDYLNEVIVFLGQAAYVYFIALWLDLKKSSPAANRFFLGIAIFFLAYAAFVFVAYTLDPYTPILNVAFKGIRLISVVIQAAVFYVLIVRVKSPVRGYVLAGTSLVLLFGVGFVAMNEAGVFDGTTWDYLDNGSWYMIGIMGECMCFASGLGLRYFLIDQSNLKLQQENINVLEEKLHAEQEARENERKLAEVNQELTNQQLTALRAQMNPHFIFNALNSIQKYVVTGNIDEANSYLSKFSRLQRMILSYSDENFISLDKELEILRLYLELEQLRLTHEFHFDIVLAEAIEPEEILIPPMMLQPFAENAIWHGLIPKAGEKTLRIEFKLSEEDILTCLVEDNGIGRKAAQKIKDEKQAPSRVTKSRGMSLVFNRLALLEKKYGRRFWVHITDKVDEQGESLGTLVELNIPLNE